MTFTTPDGSLARARERIDLIVGQYYDRPAGDEPTDLKDLLTDAIHECEARGVDAYTLFTQAEWMVGQERHDWGMS